MEVSERGTKKWTAMMMPEHTRMLEDYWESENDVEMPMLSDDQLEDIQRTLIMAIDSQQDVQIKYHEQNRLHTTDCIVRNAIGNHIEIFDDEVDFLMVEQIVSIDYA